VGAFYFDTPRRSQSSNTVRKTSNKRPRAITISNADTKILEKLLGLLPRMTSVADCDNYQFGFNNISLCAGVFRHTVDYFVTRGSHVLYHLLISPRHLTT